jgi:hypothetical protein
LLRLSLLLLRLWLRCPFDLSLRLLLLRRFLELLLPLALLLELRLLSGDRFWSLRWGYLGGTRSSSLCRGHLRRSGMIRTRFSPLRWGHLTWDWSPSLRWGQLRRGGHLIRTGASYLRRGF